MELETQLKELEKERELLEEKISKMVQDVSSYLQLIEVKDESIVKLSNKLDELELAAKIDKAASPPVLGKGEVLIPRNNRAKYLECKATSLNCINNIALSG